MKYVTYLRVSTAQQGRSGLGLDAQRKMCADFVSAHKGAIAKEFVDVESGTHRNRRGLWSAIDLCKKEGMPLVIAKLDRLARDVEFTFKVLNTGIDIHFCDMPSVNTMILGVFASVAQYERELISDRTKKALSVKKAQGAKLGAASAAYKATVEQKTKEQLYEERMKRGEMKRERHQDSLDVRTFLSVLRNVFPLYTKGEPEEWEWEKINTKADNLEQMLRLMSSYKELDQSGELFCGWDFSNKEKSTVKLRSYLQATKRSLIK